MTKKTRKQLLWGAGLGLALGLAVYYLGRRTAAVPVLLPGQVRWAS